MASKLVGDSVFSASLKEYYKHYNGKFVQTQDFVNWLSNTIPNPPVAWNVFFEQWLNYRGHPKYTLLYDGELVPTNGVGSKEFTLVQRNISEFDDRIFEMPLRLRFVINGTEVDTVVHMDSPSKKITSALFAQCTSVAIDPLLDVLCESSVERITSVADGKIHHTPFQLLGSMPKQVGSELEFVLPEHAQAITVYTIAGISQQSVDGIQDQTIVRLPSTSYAPGMYVAAVRTLVGVQMVSFILQ